MNIMLAQASVESLPASFLKNIIIFCVVAILVASIFSAAIFAGLQYFLELRRSKRAATEAQPREVQPLPLPIELTEKFVPHSVFDEHVKETRGEFQRVQKERSDDLRLAALSRRTMYDKQDALRKELTERTDAVRDDLSEKIESIPDRVIATLRNTGAI